MFFSDDYIFSQLPLSMILHIKANERFHPIEKRHEDRFMNHLWKWLEAQVDALNCGTPFENTQVGALLKQFEKVHYFSKIMFYG